jgi:ATP-dependent helicase HrpA
MSDQPAPARPIPDITYLQELPITALRDELREAIAQHPVVIVAGETGSGKTTQLPKLCLELGRGQRGIIGHTQPRRLAARTVAARIAQELGTSLGELVGYQVRFHDQVSSATAIKLMTDGILLAEMQRDRLLRQYDTLIIDEAHERSLNIDFLLGYLKRILPKRPDLKIIVTSATIDVESFSRHFGDAPVIEVSGRGYPIETYYREPEERVEDALDVQVEQAVAAIAAGEYGPAGDVLVFLPGERDIREAARALRDHRDIEVLPLYARLSQAEQNRVFNSAGKRAGIRAVLATNVAETSLTVPGIRFVVDTGLARISRYSHRTKLQRLPVEPVSRASADQRRGRCGRVGPGVCIRLYSEEDYNQRPEFTDPEIRRTNLAAVVLQMLVLKLGDVRRFEFIDPPDARMVRDGYKLLEELGAVTADNHLTDVGKRLARLPIDPRLGRMVLAADQQGCLNELLVIASALAVQDPRERPVQKQAQADQQHARFKHKRSDFLAYLQLWDHYEAQRQALSQNQLRKLCQREYLSFLRMREWRDVHRQLRIACRGLKLKLPRETTEERDVNASYDAVHKALLSGLLSNIAQWHEERDYIAARNRKLRIFPGSVLARKTPRWIVAAEIVETTRVFARQVATIDPRWALDINPALLKIHHYEPRWQPRRGQVVAYRRTSLYGLTLSDKTVVHYGPIAPGEARQIMIREGLIPGRVQRMPAFLKHNRALVESVETLESKTRRRDLLASEQAQFDFYDERLPEDICTMSRLASWLKREPEAARALRMSQEFLLAGDPGATLGEQFPDTLQSGELELPLSYQFEPGGASDGVSLTVPVALLNRVPRHRPAWLVPGMLREKCIALVKSLPKEKRKHLVPVPDHVDRALAELRSGDIDLFGALADVLSRQARVTITRDDLAALELDDYYRMNIRVVDAHGALLGQGRDLPQLLARFREETHARVTRADDDSPAREYLDSWDFDTLPREWRFEQAGVEIIAYPAVVESQEAAAIALCDYPAEARRRHRLGVLRLLRLAAASQVKHLRKQVLHGNSASLLLARAGLERDALVEDLIDAAFVQAMALDESLPYDRAAFRDCQARGQAVVVERALDLERIVLSVLEALGPVRSERAKLKSDYSASTGSDVDTQLTALLQPHFMRDTPAQWLAQYPRYFKAMQTRMERFAGQQAKDERHVEMLEPLVSPLLDALHQRPALLADCEVAERYRWMLEEFRVSLFAQQLGTRQPVSQKRLVAQWAEVERWMADNPA